MSILKKFPVIASLGLALRLFTRSIHKSGYYEFFQAKRFELISSNKLKGHIDGDAVDFSKTLKVEVIEKALNVIC